MISPQTIIGPSDTNNQQPKVTRQNIFSFANKPISENSETKKKIDCLEKNYIVSFIDSIGRGISEQPQSKDSQNKINLSQLPKSTKRGQSQN